MIKRFLERKFGIDINNPFVDLYIYIGYVVFLSLFFYFIVYPLFLHQILSIEAFERFKK